MARSEIWGDGDGGDVEHQGSSDALKTGTGENRGVWGGI